MQEELRSRIITWVKKNKDSYRQGAGGDYASCLCEDAISEFASWAKTKEAAELRGVNVRLCPRIMEGGRISGGTLLHR